MTRQSLLCAVVAGVGLTVGCGQVPAAEVASAEAALAAAQSAEADVYAPEALKAAQDSQAQLQAELTVQREKLRVLRSYARATEMATAAKAAAESAQQSAAAQKEQVRVETTQLIAAAKLAVEEASALLVTAPTGKGSQADLAAMKADLIAVGTSLGEADLALGSSRFTEARSKAQVAMDAAAKVKGAIEQAQAARKGARPRV
jgi:hypothetical protein